MSKEKRPVSYQQTLGTKTEKIQKQHNETQKNSAQSLEKADANFPE